MCIFPNLQDCHQYQISCLNICAKDLSIYLFVSSLIKKTKAHYTLQNISEIFTSKLLAIVWNILKRKPSWMEKKEQQVLLTMR